MSNKEEEEEREAEMASEMRLPNSTPGPTPAAAVATFRVWDSWFTVYGCWLLVKVLGFGV